MEQLAPLIAASINAGTPLLLAAIGLLINERSGVLNLGAEGMMLVAAIAGFAVGYATKSPLLGFVAGAVCGMLMATLFAWLALRLATNQVATGLALSIFGAGLSAFVGQRFVGLALPAQPNSIPLLGDIPFLGKALFHQHWMSYVAFALCLASIWFLYRTRAGLVLRAVASRRNRRMRWAIRCVASAIWRCCSAVLAAAWRVPTCRWSIPRCGSKAWWPDAAGSRWP